MRVAIIACLALCALASERFVRVDVSSPEQARTVGSMTRLGIDHYFAKRGYATAYVTDAERATIAAAGLAVADMPEETAMNEPEAPAAKRASWSVYHYYDDVVDMMSAWEKKYPHLAKVHVVGQSYKGRNLYMIQISDNVTVPEAGEPQVKLIANMHGDESIGRELMLRYIDTLLSEYETNKELRALVDNLDLWIMPSMNPDGFESKKRTNGRGADLNRNFPDQYSSDPDDYDGHELETVAVMKLIKSETFALSIQFHGGALVANYPFDGTKSGVSVYSKCPDDALFRMLALTYSKNHSTMSDSSEFEDGITNGAAWYCVYGGMQDYNYVYNGVPEITIEMGNTKWPAASTLPSYWEANVRSFNAYVGVATWCGARGQVTDAEGNVVAGATVSVKELKDAPAVRVRDATGSYFRLLTAGKYTLEVSAEGYETKSVRVTIPEGQKEPVVADVILTAA